MRTACEHRSAQRGHIEIGYTLAIWVILIGFFVINYLSDGAPLDMWLGWPWWGKALSILGPLVVIAIGAMFERSRQWRKL